MRERIGAALPEDPAFPSERGSPLLGLANRECPPDDLVGELFLVVRRGERRDRLGVAGGKRSIPNPVPNAAGLLAVKLELGLLKLGWIFGKKLLASRRS